MIASLRQLYAVLAARSMTQSRALGSSGDKVKDERVENAKQAVDTARKAYMKTAAEFLAAVEATPSEIEEADKIISRDIDKTGGPLPQDWLDYQENLACTILEEVRSTQLK
jgi:hypothetical protein